jgi:multiple RNA-binding domain-containing protein 1
MGFGFVELSSQSEAEKAIKKLNGKTVDGHAWELTISASKSKSLSKTPLKSGGKNPTKLIVRNVPFQATRTELLKLFGTFGQLRKVRCPKKFDGSHRGFAFVEFLTSKEAQTAMTSLSRTHLYGRRLVLEWATNDDQNVDLLREKAKRDTISISAQPTQNKRIKFED